VGFAFLVGLAMAFVFRREEKDKVAAAMALPPPEAPRRPFWQTSVFFFSLIFFLIFAAWVTPREVTIHLTDGQQVQAVVLEERSHDMIFQLAQDWDGKKAEDQVIIPKERLERLEREPSLSMTISQINSYIAGAILLLILLMLWRWFTRPEIDEWLHHTWEFTKLLAPLLYGGVLAVGFVSALIPPQYVASLVGDNGLAANFTASLIGAFWYFATLTEIPITQALMKMGMAQGPASGAAVGRAGFVAPQHDRHRPGHGLEKDRGVCHHHCHRRHRRGPGLRLAGGVRFEVCGGRARERGSLPHLSTPSTGSTGILPVQHRLEACAPGAVMGERKNRPGSQTLPALPSRKTGETT
jgi:uncharacterized membrane protein YraQ (UPF0718 family)